MQRNSRLYRIICMLLIVTLPTFAQVPESTGPDIVVVAKPYPPIVYFPEPLVTPVNNNFPTAEAQARYEAYLVQAAQAAADAARKARNDCIDQTTENSKVGVPDSAAKVVLLAESHMKFNADDYKFVIQDIAAGNMNDTCFALEQPHEIVAEVAAGKFTFPPEYSAYVQSLTAFNSWGMKTFGIDSDVPYTSKMQEYMNAHPGTDWTDKGSWNQVPLSVTNSWLDSRDANMQANINTLLNHGCKKVIALVGSTHVTGAEVTVVNGERKAESYGSGLLRRLTDAGVATQAIGLSAAAKKCIK